MALFLLRRLALPCLLAMSGPASAQGGPPLVTDDPGTPGDGHWEINVATIVARTPTARQVLAPDADINYGLGETVQLKADIPWVWAREDGAAWKSGLGAGEFGLKWRFLDQGPEGISVSTYPQYTRRLLASSVRRGLADPGHALFLPIEVASSAGGFDFDGELGRSLVHGGGSAWVAGAVLAHGCGADLECLAEVRRSNAPGDGWTLLNLGLHWELGPGLAGLAAAGRQFGHTAGNPQRALVYLGLQFTR